MLQYRDNTVTNLCLLSLLLLVRLTILLLGQPKQKIQSSQNAVTRNSHCEGLAAPLSRETRDAATQTEEERRPSEEDLLLFLARA